MSPPPGSTFRLATLADLPSVLALLAEDAVARERSSYAVEVSPAVRAAFDEISADPNNELLVGEREGEVIACLQLTYIPGLSRGGMRRALVEAVRVRADLRGQRIGEQLMEEAMARARARGCGLIQLTTDKRREAAHRFYARLGFEASHEGMKRPL
jgi:GNAT superfamily N-acetyltransferase